MSKEIHPFVELRRRIHQSGRQFRNNNDNSESLFHPDGGFCYAYDIGEVEDALDFYQTTLPMEFQEQTGNLSMEDQINTIAKRLSTEHGSMEVRDFARTVAGYMALQVHQQTNFPQIKSDKK